MKSAFVNYQDRCQLIYDVLKRGFSDLRAELDLPDRRPYGSER